MGGAVPGSLLARYPTSNHGLFVEQVIGTFYKRSFEFRRPSQEDLFGHVQDFTTKEAAAEGTVLDKLNANVNNFVTLGVNKSRVSFAGDGDDLEQLQEDVRMRYCRGARRCVPLL